MELPTRSLPHSDEAERAVLGALLLAPEELAALRQWLRPEDLYFERHATIYRAALALADEGAAADTLTLRAYLEQSGQLEEVGGVAYLSVLDLGLPDIDRVGTYAGIIVDRSLRRQAIQRAGAFIRELLDGARPIAELVAEHDHALSEIRSRSTRSTHAGTVSEILDLDDEEVATPEQVSCWGFPGADRLTVGLPPGTTTILGGQSSMGKTALAMSVVRANANAGRSVLLFSLEQDAKRLSRILLSQEAGVSVHAVMSHKIRGDGLSEVEKARISLAREAIAEWKVRIEDTRPNGRISPAPRDPEGVANWIIAEVRRQPADLVVIDHIHEMECGEDMRLGLIRGVRHVRRIPNDTGVAVLALAQVSEETARRASKFNPQTEEREYVDALRPKMNDLGEAKTLGQLVDTVAFVFRPGYFLSSLGQERAELWFRKNRYGPKDKAVRLRFDQASTAFFSERRES